MTEKWSGSRDVSVAQFVSRELVAVCGEDVQVWLVGPGTAFQIVVWAEVVII